MTDAVRLPSKNCTLIVPPAEDGILDAALLTMEDTVLERLLAGAEDGVLLAGLEDLLEAGMEDTILDLLEAGVDDCLELAGILETVLELLETAGMEDAALLAVDEAPFLIQSLTQRPEAEIWESGQLPLTLAPGRRAAEVSALSERDQLHQLILC